MTARVQRLVAPSPASTGQEKTHKRDFEVVRRLRVLARSRVSIPALGVQGAKTFAVEIVNVSQSGAGLHATHSANLDEPISLHLANGQQLTGRVRWAKMGFCGLEFEEPLAFDHRLLGQIERPAAPNRANPSGAFGAILRHVRFFTRRARNALRSGCAWIRIAAIENRLRSEQRMVEKACRKQGHAWLVDGETVAAEQRT